MNKISVMTPTYNDAKSLEETLNSLVKQTYQNWEQIIIDDGSTDNTKQIIDEFVKKNKVEDKIKYIYQENKDQLNAILNGLEQATGDYIFVLHSDDLLPENDFFKKIVKKMEENNCDAIIGDLTIIDENSQNTNCWKALKYRNKPYIPPIVMLNGGANIYGDVALWKAKVYKNQIKNNYLLWNTPFWLDLQGKPKILNVKNANFPILKYRIHTENYINNDIGKFNVLNGELRCATTLLNYYTIPLYNFQQKIYLATRAKGIRKLKLFNYYKPIYINKPTGKKGNIVKKIIKKTYGKEYEKNIFLKSLIMFYETKSDRKIEFQNLANENIYYGKDIRSFTKKLFSNNLEDFYLNLFQEMQKGFSTIEVKTEQDRELAIDIAKFLCIYPYVKITKK